MGYPTGTIVQRRNGAVYVKTDKGLIARPRLVAQQSDKVFNGGHDLQKGERVLHLDMSSHGEKDHDRPDNLVVVKWRINKYEFLTRSRVLFLPKTRPATTRQKVVSL